MVKKTLIDKRSKKIIFVPFCVLCQAFQAEGIVKGEWSSSIGPIINLIMQRDINIIQMPCPESSFNGYESGLGRKPAGLKYYDVEEYREHCKTIAKNVIEMIKGIKAQNYLIEAILGIEMSPSCAVSYIYSNKGMQKRKGVFFESLEQMCIEEKLDIPFVGINRKSTRKAMENLERIFNQN